MTKMISLRYLEVLDWYPVLIPLRDTEQEYYIFLLPVGYRYLRIYLCLIPYRFMPFKDLQT